MPACVRVLVSRAARPACQARWWLAPPAGRTWRAQHLRPHPQLRPAWSSMLEFMLELQKGSTWHDAPRGWQE